jgi:hypothetical protein
VGGGLKPAGQAAEKPHEAIQLMTSSAAMPMADSTVRRIGRLLGWISIFATLALLGPGVIATARADEPAAGPSCPAARDANEHTVVGLEQMLQSLSAAAVEQGDANGDVVTLNTRGYNYTSTLATPPPEPPERH